MIDLTTVDIEELEELELEITEEIRRRRQMNQAREDVLCTRQEMLRASRTLKTIQKTLIDEDEIESINKALNSIARYVRRLKYKSNK